MRRFRAPRNEIGDCDSAPRATPEPGPVLPASQSFAKSSVACTSSLTIPGSLMLCPASGTITSLEPGHLLWRAQALAAGHTTS